MLNKKSFIKFMLAGNRAAAMRPYLYPKCGTPGFVAPESNLEMKNLINLI